MTESRFRFLGETVAALGQLNGFSLRAQVEDFLIPSKNENSLIVRQTGDEAEIALVLQKKLLDQFADAEFPRDFSIASLPDLSILIEELSHFSLTFERMEKDLNFSGLELEVQAEVDKFCLALDWLHQQNQIELKHQLFDTLFGDPRLGHWVKAEERERYQDAHRIARQFCRGILLGDGSLAELRAKAREFYRRTSTQKLSPSY